jgi:glycine/D-amino acid oxidase-like deaminating enzyme
MRHVEAAVVGAGYFGCRAALHLRGLGFSRVLLLDREDAIMRRASFVNQARVHNGYHYPRSLGTAISSRNNYQRFCEEHAGAIRPGMRMIYAIARGSRVSPAQFERFCARIEVECHEEPSLRRDLFDPACIEAAYTVQEVAFDATAIAADLRKRLYGAGVELGLGQDVRVGRIASDRVELETSGGSVQTDVLVNCTYAGLDRIGVPIRSPLKYELVEIGFVQPPLRLENLGVTVMDGPFFSVMPFPAFRCHSLTHVRYTPHAAWTQPGDAPAGPPESRLVFMQRDAARYMPCLAQAERLGSMFDVKTVLRRSEESDARPILFEFDDATPHVVSILGAKMDNIYDALDAIGRHPWPRP